MTQYGLHDGPTCSGEASKTDQMITDTAPDGPSAGGPRGPPDCTRCPEDGPGWPDTYFSSITVQVPAFPQGLVPRTQHSSDIPEAPHISRAPFPRASSCGGDSPYGSVVDLPPPLSCLGGLGVPEFRAPFGAFKRFLVTLGPTWRQCTIERKSAQRQLADGRNGPSWPRRRPKTLQDCLSVGPRGSTRRPSLPKMPPRRPRFASRLLNMPPRGPQQAGRKPSAKF